MKGGSCYGFLWNGWGYGYGGGFYEGSAFVLIVVLFILLIIVGTCWY
ncbi:YjcZ family sporulation protein [Actinomycetes bacterium NPDC127524]